MRHPGIRPFLKIVWRQPMVGGTEVHFEIPPRSARPRAQLLPVILFKLPMRRLNRAAEPIADRWRAQPRGGKRRRAYPYVGRGLPHRQERTNGDERARGHLDLERAESTATDQSGRASGRARRGFPFEQPSLRDQQTDKRQHDRMDHVPCVVREQHERQGGLRGGRSGIIPKPPCRDPERTRPGKLQQARDQGQERGANHGQRP